MMKNSKTIANNSNANSSAIASMKRRMDSFASKKQIENLERRVATQGSQVVKPTASQLSYTKKLFEQTILCEEPIQIPRAVPVPTVPRVLKGTVKPETADLEFNYVAFNPNSFGEVSTVEQVSAADASNFDVFQYNSKVLFDGVHGNRSEPLGGSTIHLYHSLPLRDNGGKWVMPKFVVTGNDEEAVLLEDPSGAHVVQFGVKSYYPISVAADAGNSYGFSYFKFGAFGGNVTSTVSSYAPTTDIETEVSSLTTAVNFGGLGASTVTATAAITNLMLKSTFNNVFEGSALGITMSATLASGLSAAYNHISVSDFGTLAGSQAKAYDLAAIKRSCVGGNMLLKSTEVEKTEGMLIAARIPANALMLNADPEDMYSYLSSMTQTESWGMEKGAFMYRTPATIDGLEFHATNAPPIGEVLVIAWSKTEGDAVPYVEVEVRASYEYLVREEGGQTPTYSYIGPGELMLYYHALLLAYMWASENPTHSDKIKGFVKRVVKNPTVRQYAAALIKAGSAAALAAI